MTDHPHKEFIERLGKTSEVASDLGFSSQQISRFKVRGISNLTGVRTKFALLAWKKGVELPDNFLHE